MPKNKPPGYKKDGRIDLRMLPEIVFRPLGREHAYGQATQLLHSDASGDKKPVGKPLFEIDTRWTGRKRLDTDIHEALHLACPFMFEDVVGPTARYVAMILWHLGYRLKDEDD